MISLNQLNATTFASTHLKYIVFIDRITNICLDETLFMQTNNLTSRVRAKALSSQSLIWLSSLDFLPVKNPCFGVKLLDIVSTFKIRGEAAP